MVVGWRGAQSVSGVSIVGGSGFTSILYMLKLFGGRVWVYILLVGQCLVLSFFVVIN